MILNYSDCDAGANPLTMPPLYLDWVLGAAPLSTSTYLKYPNHGCDIVGGFPISPHLPSAWRGFYIWLPNYSLWEIFEKACLGVCICGVIYIQVVGVDENGWIS